MHCSNCGNKNDLHSTYCAHCGNKLKKRNRSHNSIESSYFSSRWAALLQLLLKVGIIESIRLALFVIIGFVIIEIIASLFGYCITAKDAECLGGLADIFAFPALLGVMYLIFGSFQAFQNLLTVLTTSKEAKIYFGLNQEEPAKIHEYLKVKGLTTLFLSRYWYYGFTILVSYLISNSYFNATSMFVFFIAISDLRVLRFAKRKFLATQNNKNDVIQDSAHYDTIDQTKRSKEIIKRVLKITMWTTIIFTGIILIGILLSL